MAHKPTIPPGRAAAAQAARLACRMHEQLMHSRGRQTGLLRSRIADLAARLEQLQSLSRKLALCEDRSWHHAQREQFTTLAHALRMIDSETSGIGRLIPQPVPPSSPRELLAELDQLQEEFGSWRFDAKSQILSVTTDSIVLEDVSLGPFTIELDLVALSSTSQSDACYQVVALEPNPPASSDSVTHPHVRDGILCEGDAAGPIRHALREGRLAEFFILVRSVLSTYNAHSPFVTLEDWSGTSCHDCGEVVHESCFCSGCDHDYCESCVSCCRSCDRSRCTGCLDECSDCQEPTCSSCLENCGECGQAICSNCLQDGVCSACRDAASEEQEPASTSAAERSVGLSPLEPCSSFTQEISHGCISTAPIMARASITSQQAALYLPRRSRWRSRHRDSGRAA
jgi:hypothetical protein